MEKSVDENALWFYAIESSSIGSGAAMVAVAATIKPNTKYTTNIHNTNNKTTLSQHVQRSILRARYSLYTFAGIAQVNCVYN